MRPENERVIGKVMLRGDSMSVPMGRANFGKTAVLFLEKKSFNFIETEAGHLHIAAC